MSDSDQVVHSPKSTPQTDVEQLAYLESFDAVVDKDYAYVVYKETRTGTGKWIIRIKGSVTAGTTIDPEASALKSSLKKAAGHDEEHVVWGFNLQPSGNDPRKFETRIVLDDAGKPCALEVRLVTRKADQSARDEQVATVPWPSD